MATYYGGPKLMSISSGVLANPATYSPAAGKWARVTVYPTIVATVPSQVFYNGVEVTKTASTGQTTKPFEIIMASGDTITAGSGETIRYVAVEYKNP